MENNRLRVLVGVSLPRAQLLMEDPPPSKTICYEIPLGIIEKLWPNPYVGDGTIHPDMHVIFMDELCGYQGMDLKLVIPLSL